MIDKIFRYFVYFRRGHTTYLIFMMTFMNFVGIAYFLLIQNIPYLKTVFPALETFIVLFLAVYIPTNVVIGWLDMKKASMPREVRAHPYWDKPLGKEVRGYSLLIQIAKTLSRKDTPELTKQTLSLEKWLNKKKD